MHKSLDEKLATLRDHPSANVFILADARDADMAWGISSPGLRWPPVSGAFPYRSLADYVQEGREIVAQGLVDILLTSVSTMSLLAHREKLFDTSRVTPAIRANDTTDIWLARGSSYARQPSQPFATTTIAEAQHDGIRRRDALRPTVNLGLYSVTFNNEVDRDRETLLAYKQFRRECADAGFRHFLEVFAPNAAPGLAADQVPGYVNDQIARMLAGIPRTHRPDFLKIPFFGARPLAELIAYDASLVVGILGGASGTSHDAFQLLHLARAHGARAALFGRRIKEAESPLAFVSLLRQVADGNLSPKEAVRAYHGELQKLQLPSKRSLDSDLELTQTELRHDC